MKNIIKKIPLLGKTLKIIHEKRQEKALQTKIKQFIAEPLPHVDTTPEKYSLGHEPTIRCNLRCKMCYQGETRSLRQEELGPEEVIKIYDKFDGRLKTVKIVGGEPFMRPDVFDMIAYWDARSVKIILQTNCTLINEEAVGRLKKFSNLTDILTSLDGPREVHDMVRGIPGTFDRLKKSVALIKKDMPQTKITVFATLLFSDNLEKLAELVDTCSEIGLTTINILFEQVYKPQEKEAALYIGENVLGWEKDSFSVNTQTRENVYPTGLTAEKLMGKLNEARGYGFKKGCFVNFTPYNYLSNLDKYLGDEMGRVFCTKLLSPQLRADQKGRVVWCDIIDKSFGNLKEQSPDEIWLSPEYQKFRKYLQKTALPVCSRCCKAAYVSREL